MFPSIRPRLRISPRSPRNLLGLRSLRSITLGLGLLDNAKAHQLGSIPSYGFQPLCFIL